VEAVSEIIGTMKAVAPAGRRRLDEETLRQLSDLTRSLIASKEGAPRNTRASFPSPSADCACQKRSLLTGCVMPPCW
jgi:hypothetical protein